MWHAQNKPIRILTGRRLELQVNAGNLRAKGMPGRFHDDVKSGRLIFSDELPLLPPMPRSVPIHGAGSQKGTARCDHYGGLMGMLAAWVAGGRGATVDVWGVDLGGMLDAHGAKQPGRHPGRWEGERRIWDGVLEGFRRSGELIINWTPPEER